MKRLSCWQLILILVLLPLAGQVGADVRLPSIIGENMMLQRDADIKLWGWAEPGESVTVEIAGQRMETTTAPDGRWKLGLKPLPAGGPHEMTIRANNIHHFSNIIIRDVWICSGQSNMEMRVCHIKDAPNEVAGALHRRIRLFQMTNDLSPDPRDDCEGWWEDCRPSTAGVFSAAGYFFGRKLMEDLDVPIGLINASWGGTTVETWMSLGAREFCPEFSELLDRWEPVLSARSPEVFAFYKGMAEWEEDVHHVIYAGKPVLPPYGTPPDSPVKLSIVPQMPLWVGNAMIEPLVPFAIKGAIWYQGESNAGRAYQYRSLFPALIRDWRTRWGQGDFPFLFVQLANFGKPLEKPDDSNWAELREAQLMTLDVPHTAMAIAIDVGEADDIHPRNKQEVGRRLALAALGTVYGKDIIYSGPIYSSMTVEGDEIRLRFTHVGDGLKYSGEFGLSGFTIAGEDRVFVNASARIEGDDVVVRAQGLKNPVAVRYGWEINPACNLYNTDDLPASPFRTDDRPGITVGAK